MRMMPFFVVAMAAASVSLHANPEVPRAIAVGFGQATADRILLLKGSAEKHEPTSWHAYARDPFRPSEQVSLLVTLERGKWGAQPDGEATTLRRVPARMIDFSRVKERSSDALKVAKKAAELAQAGFDQVDYQLATNAETGVPEWGLALLDKSGYEVGFCIISAETGALLFQNWTPQVEKPGLMDRLKPRTEEEEGERAARTVKKGVRKAWDWTENAGKQTGNFFRELFR